MGFPGIQNASVGEGRITWKEELSSHPPWILLKGRGAQETKQEL